MLRFPGLHDPVERVEDDEDDLEPPDLDSSQAFPQPSPDQLYPCPENNDQPRGQRG